MDFQVTSTSQARTSCTTLSSDAKYYTSLVEQLRSASEQIKANWEGDANDINDIILRINNVCIEFESKIIPTLKSLSVTITTLANETDRIAGNPAYGGSGSSSGGSGSGNSVNNDGSSPRSGGAGNNNSGSNSGSGDSGSSNPAGAATDSGKTEKKSFWEYHGENFANDWDYSGCDGALDYVGATVDGIVGATGSAINFVVDGCSEILGWLFN